MRPVAFAATLAFAVALTAAPAFAVPHINVTNSEIVGTVPLRVKTTFTYEDVGYRPCCYSVDFFVTSSGAGPVVHFYAGESDALWTPYLTNGDANVYFQHTNNAAYSGLHTFSIVTDQATPCVEITFWDYLLSKTPTTTNNYVIQACLAVDMPTPAHVATWGAVKGIYR
jgi:hypothetical protein